jgi:uncharacterized membrane protein
LDSRKKRLLSSVLFRVGMVAILSLTMVIVQTYRPDYQLLDILLVLAVGMLLGAFYVEGADRIDRHFAA